MKVKQVMVDEKKHIRFADWNANDVSIKLFEINSNNFEQMFDFRLKS